MFPAIVHFQATIPGTIRSEASFNALWSFPGGAFRIDVHHVLAEGDLVVVLATVNAQRSGVSASFPEVHVWQMRDGKAVEFREYQGDEQREDRFWS